MNQVAILKINKGSLQQGFSQVILQLERLSHHKKQVIGNLPPAPYLAELYQQWRFFYIALYGHLGESLRITFSDDKPIPTNVSQVEFAKLCQKLKSSFNQWLDAQEFRPLERQLRSFLASDTPIHFLIETDDLQLRQFPWHLWTLFRDFPLAEVALSSPRFERIVTPINYLTHKVRILAVFGNSKNLDLTGDLATLQKLPNVYLKVLIEPSQQTLTDTLWQHPWEIFFFAGHSNSSSDGEEGDLQLSHERILKVADLSNAINHAINQGLQIAIFNSCQGLGIVRELEKSNLHIPQIIVMREPVPDPVAHFFLMYFLEAFSGGQSFYLAVREARERLQGLEPPVKEITANYPQKESFFPCASWLPVIYQNPAVIPPKWETLHCLTPKQSSQPWSSQSSKLLGLSSLTTFLVVMMRLLGWFQGIEMKAYDTLLQWRPSEGIDDRVLLVEATETELNQYGFPLPDGVIAEVVDKLSSYSPRVIGLDIYRDRPIEPGSKTLVQVLQSNPYLVALCSIGESENLNKPGIAPPAILPSNRLGFSDIVIDFDGVVRRHLLFMQPTLDETCQTDHSLNVRVAFQYLQAEGITPQLVNKEQIKLGKATFLPLSTRNGGYQQLDARGYQLLLNYRTPQLTTQRISIADVLSGNFEASLVKNKAILVGITAPSSADRWGTPYRFQTGTYQEIPGVELQVQMVSQILSSALDGRSLIWVWPIWGEVLWIGIGSMIGVSIVLFCSSRIIRIVLIIGSLSLLTAICWLFLLIGGWLPLVPFALVLLISYFFANSYVMFLKHLKIGNFE